MKMILKPLMFLLPEIMLTWQWLKVVQVMSITNDMTGIHNK